MLIVCERVEVVEWNKKNGPFPSPTILWVVTVRERNPDRKKTHAYTHTQHWKWEREGFSQNILSKIVEPT